MFFYDKNYIVRLSRLNKNNGAHIFYTMLIVVNIGV